MSATMARFLAYKFKTCSPLLKEFRQCRANDLLSRLLPVCGSPPVAGIFQTCACLAQIKGRKTWKDLPQPEIKPYPQERYERWRKFIKHSSKAEPQKTDSLGTQSEIIPKEIFQRIDQQIMTETTGRLFAVVQIAGKQFKITTEDIIVMQGTFAPTIGDELQLEKVMLVGSADFTLVGRPLLNKDLLKVEVTVIEKTLSQIMVHFKMKRRKQYRRTRFRRETFTMLRINNIQLREGINAIKDVEGLEDKIF